MKKIKIIIIFIIITNFFIFSDSQNKNLIRKYNIGKQYLVLIGIDDYRYRLTLNGNVEKLLEIKGLLTSKYQIDEVIELFDFNANKTNIEWTLRNLAGRITLNDSVLIIYSGHGYFDRDNNEGYWIPYDGGINEDEKKGWISNDKILNQLKLFNASNICLVVNSCFAENDLIDISNIDIKSDYTDEELEEYYKRKSRIVLLSGITETGNGDTDFINEFIKQLSLNNKLFIDIHSIFKNIKGNISDNNLMLGSINNSKHENESTFMLYKKEDFFVLKEEDKVIEDKKKEDKKEEDKTVIEEKKEEKKKIDWAKVRENFRKLPNLTKIGIIICPIGVNLLIIGGGIFAFDMFGYYPNVLSQQDPDMSDSSYTNLYYTHLGLFSAGIAIMAVGGAFTIASIPLFIVGAVINYRRKNNISFIIDFNKNIDIGIKYSF